MENKTENIKTEDVEKVIKYRTKLGVIEYSALVNEIASEYFDVSGNYAPHFGFLNTMRIFYNKIVEDSKFDIPHDINDINNMEILTNDEEFIMSFNESITFKGKRIDFANAYKDAMDIVEVEKTSMNMAITKIKNVLADMIENISSSFTGENLEKIVNIAKEISNGKITEQGIVDAFGNSEAFKKILDKE